jgi:2,4-dienoyl-CoA reductase-like NADH-dependent reductase (Old Yellow Enzyme family)
MTSLLFTPLQLRNVTFKNRIGVAPMCQYSCQEGLASNWHLVHLGSRAVGGAGMVMVEAAAVSADGRISPADLGIWSDAHASALAPSIAFINEQHAVSAIQLAHAGRKGSTQVPWHGRKAVPPEDGGWSVQGPSDLAFNDVYPLPAAMTEDDITRVINEFVAAAQRCLEIGIKVIELHMGHGYLMHQFLSPLSNHREDHYGGSFDARVRVPLRLVEAVREAWPEELPLFVRLSATDWIEEGWDIEQSVELSVRMKALGVDLVDCSSGSIVPGSQGTASPGFQVPFAEKIKREAKIATAAVGLITQAMQAEEILRHGRADMVLLARELLRDPYWPLRAAAELDGTSPWPVQYLRAVGS